jgi:uncharacterized protein YlxW (UPF0749 family)
LSEQQPPVGQGEMNTIMSKHISYIADQLIEKKDELQRENTQLRQQVKDLEAALRHTQRNTYADDVRGDDDSCADQVLRVLRGK